MIITIAGTAGSGKSTLARNLIKQLDAKRIYVGGIRRELARSKSMTIEELNEYAKEHPETDVDVDKAAAKEALRVTREGGRIFIGTINSSVSSLSLISLSFSQFLRYNK